MKRTLKKVMSILLSFILVFGSFAFGFSDVNWSDFAVKAEATETFTEGYYTYTVDDNGEATIIDFDDSISGDVVIPSTLGGYGVIYIGQEAFDYCNLSSVTIPYTIASIGDKAFYHCTSLASVTFEKDSELTYIGDYAFYITDLFDIVIPSNVTSIGYLAFGLDSVYSFFIKMTGITSISVEPTNAVYSSDEYGVLFNKDKTLLIQYPAGNTRTNYKVPDSVIGIKEGAFKNCKNLASVTFGENSKLTSISSYGFEGCKGLTSIEIPDSVSSIGSYTFFNCTGLESVIFGENSELTSISNYVFDNCSRLSSIVIPASVTSIGYCAFYLCSRLSFVKYTGDVSGWCKIDINEYACLTPDYLYFNGELVTDLVIPDSVTFIGDYTFYGCTGLTSVTLGDGVESIGSHSFYNCTGLKSVTFSENSKLTHIGGNAFYGCTGIKSIDIPDSVKIIYWGDIAIVNGGAFGGCTGLKSVTIGNGVTNIGRDAFIGCTALTDVYYRGDISSWCKIQFDGERSNPIYYAENFFVDGKRVTDLVIPGSVTSIGEYAFSNYDSLTSVNIPDSVTSIGDYAFRYCPGLISITVDPTNTKYSSDEYGVLFNKDKTELIQYPTGNVRADYKIPDSVTTIRGGAFFKCTGLVSITIPDGVWSIDSYMFSHCSSLTTATIPNSVEIIDDYAFDGTALTDVYYIGTQTEWNKIRILDNSVLNATIHFDYEDEPTTESATKPTETELSTTKPVVEPTTKPIVTEPSTTKPAEVPTTTKPVETTKPTTAPTTKPESTTKPEPIEEEIIKKPSTSTVKYGETLILHADFANIPEGAKIEWSVEGNGVTIVPSADGKTCAVTSTSTGDVTITAKYTDANGIEHVSEQEIKSNASFWQKIVSFFKNLFGINRIIEQRIKF